MKTRNSFRGTGITEEFAKNFKESKFYSVYCKHKDEIIIGVRDSYICLYYNCDCIAKIKPSKNLTAQINEYYTNTSGCTKLTDDEFEDLYSSIKKKSAERTTEEKQAQQKLFIQNNKNSKSNWYCIDTEFAKSLKGKTTQENWRFDIIAISKSKPHEIALIEIKYGNKAIGGKSGIRKHIKDFYNLHLQQTIKHKELKEELVSIAQKLQLLGVDIPKELADINVDDFTKEPNYYIITLDNNPNTPKASSPKQSMSGYLFNDKRWGAKKVSKSVEEEGDIFKLTRKDKSFKSTFLFSEEKLPNIKIEDIINDSSYEREEF